jgi:hypothetical protein
MFGGGPAYYDTDGELSGGGGPPGRGRHAPNKGKPRKSFADKFNAKATHFWLLTPWNKVIWECAMCFRNGM